MSEERPGGPVERIVSLQHDPQKVQIGFYHAGCCLLDLYRIDDTEQLEEVREQMQDEDIGGCMVFASLADAVAYLGQSGLTADEVRREYTRLGWNAS